MVEFRNLTGLLFRLSVRGRSGLSCSLLTSSRHVCHREVKKPPDWAELTDGNRVFVGTRTGIEGAATEHMALSYSQVETLDCV